MKFGLEVHLEVDVLAHQTLALNLSRIRFEEIFQICAFFFIKSENTHLRVGQGH